MSSRPAVLIVDPDSARRRGLAEGLAGHGYEAIPAASAEEGRRFAAGLGPGVIVSPLGTPGFGGPEILAELEGTAAVGSTLLLLGTSDADGEALPEQVLYLAIGELEPPEIVRRLRLVLVGWEVEGLAPDSRLESLVGELALAPILELVRSLGRALVSGRLLVEGGEIAFERGEAIAARVGGVTGVKAFCRLARRRDGWVRVVLGRAGVRRDVELSLDALVIRALEDLAAAEVPNLKARLAVAMGPEFFSRQFTRAQQEILGEAPERPTVGELLDRFGGTDGQILGALAELVEAGVVRIEEPETGVRIVTDSTADLPHRLARDHGIRVVPLTVRFGDDLLRDGVDLEPREFYRRLTGKGPHPVSSPPTPGDFRQAYLAEAAERDVVSIHLSGKLSETVANARKAVASGRVEIRALRAASADRLSLEVVDGHQVSLGLGLLAVFAARMGMRGLEAAQIVRRLEAARDRIEVLFAVDSLEFLARGGRIGKAQALVGNLLRVKPILGVAGGEVVPVDRVRGGRAAHPRMLELFRERLDPERPVVGAIAHAAAPVWAERLRELVQAELEPTELFVAEIGPVVGTHAGPGTVGAALFQPEADEAELFAPL